MWYLSGFPIENGPTFWSIKEDPVDTEEGVKVTYDVQSFSKIHRTEAIKRLKKKLEKFPESWLIPGYKEWVLDLDKLKESYPAISSLNWLIGKILIEPEFEPDEREVFGNVKYQGNIVFYITPEAIQEQNILTEVPVEIQNSLRLFKRDFPDKNQVAFIMMRFGKTKAHNDILNAIKGSLKSYGIKGVRADEKEYHDDLYHNILTYIYGCNFGIAVFERIESQEFNPNISFELGYMSALKKPVCILKDKTLKTLQTDLVGKLYKNFDPQDPIGTIPNEISKWLFDKGII